MNVEAWFREKKGGRIIFNCSPTDYQNLMVELKPTEGFEPFMKLINPHHKIKGPISTPKITIIWFC
jgi:hypothetical protein